MYVYVLKSYTHTKEVHIWLHNFASFQLESLHLLPGFAGEILHVGLPNAKLQGRKAGFATGNADLCAWEVLPGA